jgi:flagellar biogenesis protein FliO
MPRVLRLLIFALVGMAAASGQAQPDDRYSDWRSETSPPSADQNAAEAPYQAAAEETAQAPTTEPGWQLPPGSPRKLPFRFERAPAGHDAGQVVHASALEPAKPLPKSSAPNRDEKHAGRTSNQGSGASTISMVSIGGSVAVVVGLFLIVAWTARRGIGSIPPTLPRDALEVLGRKRFAGKQEMQLVRLGSKLVLIHVVPGHAEALCEITDPAEVDRLTGICYQLHPRSSTRNFRETFDKFSQERPAARSTARTSGDKLDLSIFESVGRRAS